MYAGFKGYMHLNVANSVSHISFNCILLKNFKSLFYFVALQSSSYKEGQIWGQIRQLYFRLPIHMCRTPGELDDLMKMICYPHLGQSSSKSGYKIYFSDFWFQLRVSGVRTDQVTNQ